MEFENKTVIITGAASGIALLTAKNFAQQNANVVMVDVSDEVIKIAKEIDEGKGKVLGIICDVRDFDQVEETVSTAKNKFGTVDLLVNLAGGSATRIFDYTGEFKDIPVDILDWGIDVNLKGQLYFARAVMPYMVEQRSGVIINIGSISGEQGSSGTVEYSTAKSGVMYGLTKSLAQYGAGYGIRCCCVSPGPVLTRSNMATMKTLLNRAAEPQEIVDMIMYLCSEKAAFITGTNYLIDGGRHCMRP